MNVLWNSYAIKLVIAMLLTTPYGTVVTLYMCIYRDMEMVCTMSLPTTQNSVKVFACKKTCVLRRQLYLILQSKFRFASVQQIYQGFLTWGT